MSPSYQKLKTRVKQFLDQKIRARNFEARNARTVKRNTGEKQKQKVSRRVQEEILAISATMASTWSMYMLSHSEIADEQRW